MLRSLCLLVAGSTLAACAQGKDPAAVTTFAVAATSSEVATIAYGQTSPSIKVDAGKKHSGRLQFTGNRGDSVDIWVRSSNGDAVATVVDAAQTTLTTNDDADCTVSDSHLVLTLPADGAYQIVFRDYDWKRASFQVTLAGSGVFTCAADADCVAVDKAGCCHNGWLDAVAAASVESYNVLYECSESAPICAQYKVVDTRVAICDRTVGHCAMVQPADIVCGGFAPQHGCPTGFSCQADGPGADRTGHCAAVQQ
jgi:hypothetical protein